MHEGRLMTSVQSSLLLLLLVTAHTALGQTINVDWKLYGFAVVNLKHPLIFSNVISIS
jgi:hypothetical protein